MEGTGSWLRLMVVLTCLVAASGARELRVRSKAHKAVYNHTLASCHDVGGVCIGHLTELLSWTCPRCDGKTKAYVGVAKDLNAMVIAFRGTQEHSIQNWVEDLYWKQLDINYPGMPGAMVHHGFYFAYHNTTIRPGILDVVIRAKDLYGDINVMVTGHSMGGGMASFCGLDLVVNHEARNVQVLTFGQPRIGNAVFASYYSDRVPNTIRITNGHDIVPHLPPYYSRFPQKTYHHFPREVWLYNIGFGSLVYQVEKVCDSSGEDPSCSRSVTGNSIADHLVYYGVGLMAETWGSCKIVMDARLKEYGSEDIKGNLLLSRNPSASTLRLPSDSNAKSNFS
ncbi:LOW QUALITY PROTEIN: lipase-like [Eucalyptus grandis]|uniref:LOW QUALITY PROTEIN: lipase-like n=1 Tax=Eucalyptus grandis TaxID=71139 RepID=UPI00192F1057|nr:LOW QUALITY PROTEIN: lipase-like [Eucalyptus grandis]